MAATHEDRNAQLSPGVAIKAPCKAATTAAITLSAEQTIDGISCVSGDRVLVKNQSDQTTNGIYEVSTGAWDRAQDFDGNRDVVTGTFVFIVSGTVNAGAFYECTTTGDVVFGTSNITFAQGGLGPIVVPILASNVNFTAAGAGAVQDTLQNEIRLRGPMPQNYGALGDGSTDDSAAFAAWLTAINGKVGYIPQPTVAYKLPNGISITGHSFTTINSDAFSKLDCTAMVAGFAITIDSCQFCDLNFGSVNAGFSGIKVSRTASNSDYNRIGYQRLQGSGKQVTKPADPLANRIGISFVGPTLGQENYFHTVKPGGKIDSFDTNISFSGNANANGIVVHSPVLSGCWFGVYHNAADNQVLDGMWGGALGTDASHLAECVRYGDGATTAAWNVTTGVAEPGGANCTVGLAQANAIRNLTIIRDNLDTAYTDNGTNNRWVTSLTDVFNGGEYPIITRGTFTPTIGDGTHNCTTSIAAGFWERRTTSGGSMLSFTLALVTTAKTSVSGTILVGGLPVASNAAANRLGNHVIGQYGGITFDAGYTQVSAYQNPGSTFVRLSEGGSGKAAQDLVDTNIAAATTINLTGHYFV